MMITLMYKFFLFYKPKGRRGELTFWRSQNPTFVFQKFRTDQPCGRPG